jgi:hypothetical protein
MARQKVQVFDAMRYRTWHVPLSDAETMVATGEARRVHQVDANGRKPGPWWIELIAGKAAARTSDPSLGAWDAEAVSGVHGPAIAGRVARERVAPRAPGWVGP